MFLQDWTTQRYKEDWTESPNILQELLLFILCLFGVFANGEFINSVAYGKLTTNPCLLNLAIGNLLAIFCLPLELLNFNSIKVTLARDIAEGVQVSGLLVHAITRFVQALKVQLCVRDSAVIWKTGDSSCTILSQEKCDNDCTRNISYHFTFSERLSLLITFFIWCLALCYSWPTLFNLINIKDYVNPDYRTIPNYSLLMYPLTLFPIIIFLVIFHHLIRKSNNSKDLFSERSVIISLVCLLAGNYFLMFICLTQKHLVQKYLYLTPRTLDYIQNFPVYMTVTLVPVVVYCSSESFRSEINRLFRNKREVKKEFRNKIIHI